MYTVYNREETHTHLLPHRCTDEKNTPTNTLTYSHTHAVDAGEVAVLERSVALSKGAFYSVHNL